MKNIKTIKNDIENFQKQLKSYENNFNNFLALKNNFDQYLEFNDRNYLINANDIFFSYFYENKRDSVLFSVLIHKQIKKSTLSDTNKHYLLKFQQSRFSTCRDLKTYLSRFDVENVLNNSNKNYKVHEQNTIKYFINKFKYFLDSDKKRLSKFNIHI